MARKRPAVLFAVFFCALGLQFHPAQAATLEETQQSAVARFGTLRPRAWGEDLPGVRRAFKPRNEGDFALALTLDACGGRAKRKPACRGGIPGGTVYAYRANSQI